MSTMVPWYHATMVPWHHGAMAPWYYGTMAPWYYGTMVPWDHGTMEPWYQGAMAPWDHGNMVPWCHGIRDQGTRDQGLSWKLFVKAFREGFSWRLFVKAFREELIASELKHLEQVRMRIKRIARCNVCHRCRDVESRSIADSDVGIGSPLRFYRF